MLKLFGFCLLQIKICSSARWMNSNEQVINFCGFVYTLMHALCVLHADTPSYTVWLCLCLFCLCMIEEKLFSQLKTVFSKNPVFSGVFCPSLCFVLADSSVCSLGRSVLIGIFLFRDRKGRMPLFECGNECGTGCGLLFVILFFLFDLNNSWFCLFFCFLSALQRFSNCARHCEVIFDV